MDTLDLGKQNIFTTLWGAKGGLDNISCLNKPHCSQLLRTMTEFIVTENPYTKTLQSPEPEVQGKC